MKKPWTTTDCSMHMVVHVHSKKSRISNQKAKKEAELFAWPKQSETKAWPFHAVNEPVCEHDGRLWWPRQSIIRRQIPTNQSTCNIQSIASSQLGNLPFDRTNANAKKSILAF
jgi:hypothetical protein